jgi:hypothetical protein
MLWSPAARRRVVPRIPVESFCTEVREDGVCHALVVDVSEHGLRIQRPLGGPRSRTVALEFEVPGVDEIVWATGELCFDQAWNLPRTGGGLSGLVRTSGVRLTGVAARHQRLLREYVVETWRVARRAAQVDHCLLAASCYARG